MGRIITPEDLIEYPVIRADWEAAGNIPVFSSAGIYYRRIDETDSFVEMPKQQERSSFGSVLNRMYGHYPPQVNDDDIAVGDFPKGDRW